jgi:hypothetical protein
MAFMTKSGDRKNSKFRAKRADREHEKDTMGKKEEEGAENKMHSSEPKDKVESPAEEAGEEMVHPDIHAEIKQIAAEHGPAHTVNMTHDHENMKSHVHSVHMDGHEHHAEHEGEGHVMNASHHAMHASGVQPPEGPEEPEHEEMDKMGGEGDDYEVQGL